MRDATSESIINISNKIRLSANLKLKQSKIRFSFDRISNVPNI